MRSNSSGYAPNVLNNPTYLMKKISTILLLAITLLSACGTETSNTTKTQLDVVATFYPLAYFAEQIGGDLVSVLNLTPVGGEPHDFEPSPSQIVQVTEADVALYLGLGFEPWMEDLEFELEAKDVVALEVNSKLTLLQAEEEGREAYDPHTWLDPITAQGIVIAIKNAFIEADPENEASYSSNAEALVRELQDLHETYTASLATCEMNSLIVSHDAFNYLANRYSLNFVAVSGLSPEDEPSADGLTELADFAKTNESKYIFFETLANPDVAETLAEEAGLTPLSFNPLEGLTEKEIQEGQNYFTIMLENLGNLTLALSCK